MVFVSCLSMLIFNTNADFYDPNDEGGLLWSDKNINIPWPIKDPLISTKDQNNMGLNQFL